MIILLLLIPSLVFSTDLPEIDWTKCGVEKKCFCATKANILRIDAVDVDPVPDSANCDIGLQNKFFSRDTALFQMQVIEDVTDLGASPELMLYQGNRKLFGCTRKDEKLKMDGDLDLIRRYKIKLFEDRSHFEKIPAPCSTRCTRALCAFKMERVSKFINWMHENNLMNQKPTIRFGTKNFEDRVGAGFYEWMTNKCDPYSFKDQTTFTGFHVLPVVNRDQDVLNCENYEHSHQRKYSMRYQKQSGEVLEIKELRCEGDAGTGYKYKIINDDSGKTEDVEEPKSLNFFCAAPLNETCANPLSGCTSDCPDYTPGSSGQVPTLKCEGKKWMIGDEYYELEVEPVCRHDPASKGAGASFYTKLPSSETKTESGQCFKEYNCKKKSKLNYPECKEDDADDKCAKIDFTNGVMRCKNENKRLRFINIKTKAELFEKNVTCSVNTGFWQNEKKENMDVNSVVRCIGNEDFKKSKATFTEKQLIFIIAGIIGGGILLALSVLGLLYCYNYFKNSVKMKGKMEWKEMKTAEQLAHCKLVFGEASQATSTSLYRIQHGLHLISVLLETETVEPKIWEEAYMFLRRIHWTLDKMDCNIGHMYSRYLYLQVKIIIEKHGWTQSTPIIKRSDKGLMRVVAIRFLSFLLSDKKLEPEACKLLEEGFRQLGFRGEEHYPHCGVMWFIISNCRIYRIGEGEIKPVYFNREEFMTGLRESMLKLEMPEENVIPEFGSPSMQAIEAIGGSPILEYNRANHGIYINIVTHKSSMMKYFTGMATSLYCNAAPLLFYVFGLWQPNKKGNPFPKLTEFYKHAPENEWIPIIDSIMKLMVYYGQPLDSKKLQDRFLPSLPESTRSSKANQLSVDQQFFEEAAEAQKEDLRKWLAARTDILELKKKPDYKRNLKQDAHIYKGKTAKKAQVPGSNTNVPVSAPAVASEAAGATPDLLSPIPPAASIVPGADAAAAPSVPAVSLPPAAAEVAVPTPAAPTPPKKV